MKLLIPDLVPNTQYAIEVRAVRTTGVSEWSTRSFIATVNDTVLPLTPVNITWAVSGDTFAGSWDATTINVNSEQINIVRYEVELTANSLTRILSVPQTTGSKVYYNLSFEENRSLFGTPQPAIGMRVRSVSNIDTKSTWSSIINASNPVPGAPTAVTAVAGNNQVGLTWTPPTDNDLIGYNVYFGATKVTFINATSWTYYTSGYVPTVLTVKAVDKFNQESAGANSNSVTPTSPSTVDTVAPDAPTSLAASITNNANGIGARAAVSWVMTSPPSDLAGYYVRYRKVGDTNYSNVSFSKDVLAGTIELQSAYTNYEFQIKAFDWSANESAWSTTTTATSPANTAPSTVATMASSPTSDAIVYTWVPVTDADLKNYEVTFSTSATFASGNVTFYTGTAATLSVGGLTPSTNYYARVRAVDTSGTPSSAWSSTNTTTTSSVVNSVKDYSIEYALNSSETVAPTTGWSTTAPTRTAGTFIWTRTVITYQDNTTSTTSPVLLTGNTGSAGTPGTPAADITLTATTQILGSPAGGGATTPTTSTVTGTSVNTTITAWTYSVDGAAYSATLPAGVSRTGNVVTITGSTMTAKTITVQMADAAGVADTLTVAKVFDGATGGTGGTGPAGADAYTVILTNEAQVFPGTVSAAQAGSTTTTVIAYKGTVQQTATIGAITGQVTGLTTAITNNGTTTATVTVTVTTSLTTGGTLTIPITVGGIVFTKKFTWSVGFAGAAGATGVSVTSVTPYFAQLATGSAAPALPGNVATPPAPWVATEPTYAANTELWTTSRVAYSNGTYAYTTVVKSSSYAAAATAITTANGKNKVTYSTGTPGTTANTAGDIWFQTLGTGIIGQWQGNGGTSWTSVTLTNSVISTLDAGKLTAGTISAQTIQISNTGSLQSTDYAVGSAGWKISTGGLEINNGSVKASALTAGTLGSSTGIIQIGTGASIVMNGGYLKSNTYTGTTQATNPSGAGFYLGNDGLRIDQGIVSASALTTGTISGTSTITLSGADAKIVGPGFELSGSGLTVTSGTVAAETISVTSTFADNVTAATTTIDGGKINTGSLQSTALSRVWDSITGTYVDGTDPAWSINMAGGASFSNMAVTGSIVVGTSDQTQSAKYVVGSANYTPGVTGWMIRGDGLAEFNQLVSESIDGAAITGGTLTIDKIGSGNLTSAITITGTGGFVMGDNGAGNAAVKLNPVDGLVIDPVGSAYINVPTSGLPVTFQNVGIIATDITVQDNFELRGASNRISGTLALSTGVDNPTIGPSVASTWSDRLLGPVSMSLTSFGHSYSSLIDGGTVWITADKSAAGGGANARKIIGINKTTGVVTDVATPTMLGLSTDGYVYGVTKLGTDYYVLVVKSIPSQGISYVKVFNSSWVQTNEWQTPMLGGTPINISNDGTNIYLVYQSANPSSDLIKRIVRVPTTGGSVRANLIPNPSFEVDVATWASPSNTVFTRSNTVGGQVGTSAVRIESLPQRTNLVLNPSFEVDTSGWSTPFPGAIARVAGGSSGGYAIRINTTSAGTSAGIMHSAFIPVVAGSTYTFSFDFKQSVSRTTQVNIGWYNAAGTSLSSSASFTTSSGSTFSRKYFSFVPPAGAAQAFVSITVISIASTTEYHYIDAVLFEKGGILGYFDGSMGTDYYWTGAANASASVYHPPVDAYVYTPLMSVQAAKDYTASVYARGSASNNIVTNINWYDSSSALISWVSSTAAADTTGAFTRFSKTATAPSGATQAIMFVHVPSLPRGQYQYLDAFMFEQASAVGTYFDGSSVSAGKTYIWTGSANASTSYESAVVPDFSITQQYVNTIWVGTADFGSKKIVMPSLNGITYVYDAITGTTSTTNNWDAVGSEVTYGLTWDGSRFTAMTVSDGNYPTTSEALSFWSLGATTADTTRSVRYSQYDTTSPTHETAWSPPISATQKARQLLRVSSSSPQGSGGVDEPNSIRHYISTGGGAYYKQPDITSAPWVGIYETPAIGTATAVSSPDFSLVGNPGVVSSTSSDVNGAIISLKGDGSGRSGPLSWDKTGTGTVGIVPGMVQAYAGAVVPVGCGWLLCDGTAKSRITYASLFAAIGTTFGVGDGSTTFNLPNLQERVPIGKSGNFPTVGSVGGEISHILTTAEMPSHNHGGKPQTDSVTLAWGGSFAAGTNRSGWSNTASTGNNFYVASEGGGDAHNNMQPYVVMNYIIKY